MGQNPSEEELNGIIMEIDVDGSGTIDFSEFVNLMKEKISEVDVENDIRSDKVHILLIESIDASILGSSSPSITSKS